MDKNLFSSLAFLATILTININAVGGEADLETDELIARLMQEEYRKASGGGGGAAAAASHNGVAAAASHPGSDEVDPATDELIARLMQEEYKKAGGGGGAAAAAANPSGAAAAAAGAGSSSTDFSAHSHQEGIHPVKYLELCNNLQALDFDTRKQFLVSGQYSATTLGFDDQAADRIYTAYFASLAAGDDSEKATEPYQYTDWDFNAFAKLAEYMNKTNQLTASNFEDPESAAFSDEIIKIATFVRSKAYVYSSEGSDHLLKEIEMFKSVYNKFSVMAESSEEEVKRVLAEIFKELF
jgi:hypothetical protein